MLLFRNFGCYGSCKIEMGFFLSGPHAGTPLHHAVKQGLEATVELLLRCGGMLYGFFF